MIHNKAKLSRKVINDVKSVCGSLYSLNAPGAIGYLFNVNENNSAIARGMFCDFESEINRDDWTYYLDYKTMILDVIS